ncbi:hypothetical protein H5T53_04430 [Candidatus Bipolaricaulota bacterium]|nr:hypothetical protein [Candidatus Bipolaricaulota bacterium]
MGELGRLLENVLGQGEMVLELEQLQDLPGVQRIGLGRPGKTSLNRASFRLFTLYRV